MKEKEVAKKEDLKDVKRAKKGRKTLVPGIVKYGTPASDVDKDAVMGTGNEK